MPTIEETYTREQMIDALVEDVNNWDLASLIESVQYSMQIELENSSTSELVQEFVHVILGDDDTIEKTISP